ncbi:MAG: zeta toxin family protein [Neisseriaceae bacterium]|nr:zeta toxin family protein [Neisseriaceae bacterium]
MSRSKSADKPTPELIEELYNEQVQRKNLTPATHPNVVFVTGVAGSGKTHNTKNVKEDPVFNVFSIHPDDYRKRHPKLKQLIETHGRDNAHEYTGSFSNRTALALRDKAIENRLNVVYEATFGNIETAKNLIDSFADNGYRVTVIALPVNLELSIERNEERYQVKKEDMHTLPRKVSLEHIQKMADNFMNNLNELENNGVVVYRVFNHHEARQTINDTVVSLQKNILTQEEAQTQMMSVYAEFIPENSEAYKDAEKRVEQQIATHYKQGKTLTPQDIQQVRENFTQKMPQVWQDYHQAAAK